jgi:diaminopimelate decarboxylase
MSVSDAELMKISDEFGTPFYIYDADAIANQFARLKSVFGPLFGVSYAVKANPNLALLRFVMPYVSTFDVSSYKEVERVLEIGCPAEKITFSGPAKRDAEIRAAVEQCIGELVIESISEARVANECCKELGLRQKILLRINPSTGPKHFGVSFSGRASQFGVDEEALEDALITIATFDGLDLVGFHIYSGTNSLNAAAISENMEGFVKIFRRAAEFANVSPTKLVFGSGFGLPYGAADTPLAIEEVAEAVGPIIIGLKAEDRFKNAECVLEIGRWLVGAAGLLVTSVIAEKQSRGVDLRLCDAGFNNHLAAFGMMGTVIKRNWRIRNVSDPAGPEKKYTLVGPLCTSIDVLATDIVLPTVSRGDLLAVENSGAYGLTASPTRFISHPEPKEYFVENGSVKDVSESSANTWVYADRSGHVVASPAIISQNG